MPAAGLVRLSPGTHVGKRWIIIKQLGAGEFGTVYLCQDNNGRRVALKAEPIIKERSSCIKKEVQIMRKIGALRDGRRDHFCRFLEYHRKVKQQDAESGSQLHFNYFVMSLVGPGLDRLRSKAGGNFSPGTAVGASIQLLKALSALHSIGYLHLDLKPENAAVGRRSTNERRLLYLIDFGLARRYRDNDGQLRRQRSKSSFRGTPLYAPISAHIRRDYCRRDDLESWFYVLVELYTGSLPWSHVRGEHQIKEMKCQRLRKQPTEVRRQAVFELVQGCPPHFARILQHIDNLDFSDQPNYEEIEMILRSYLREHGIDEHPYDWEKGSNMETSEMEGPPIPTPRADEQRDHPSAADVPSEQSDAEQSEQSAVDDEQSERSATDDEPSERSTAEDGPRERSTAEDGPNGNDDDYVSILVSRVTSDFSSGLRYLYSLLIHMV